MLLNILVNLYSALLAVIAMAVLCRRYDKEVLTYRNKKVRSSIAYCVFTVLVLIIISAVQLRYACEKDGTYVYSQIRLSMLFWGCYLLGWIDYKERIIPNKIVLGLCIARIVLLAYELMINFEFWRSTLISYLLGALIGVMVIGAILLIAGKGVGMGDAKLFLVVGMYVGIEDIFAVMTYSFIASAVMVIVLLILRKVKLKDSMPMAPFVFLGLAVRYIALI